MIDVAQFISVVRKKAGFFRFTVVHGTANNMNQQFERYYMMEWVFYSRAQYYHHHESIQCRIESRSPIVKLHFPSYLTSCCIFEPCLTDSTYWVKHLLCIPLKRNISEYRSSRPSSGANFFLQTAQCFKVCRNCTLALNCMPAVAECNARTEHRALKLLNREYTLQIDILCARFLFKGQSKSENETSNLNNPTKDESGRQDSDSRASSLFRGAFQTPSSTNRFGDNSVVQTIANYWLSNAKKSSVFSYEKLENLLFSRTRRS